MSRRILVLGADGFIGRRVVAQLAASGWAIPVAAGRRRLKGSVPSIDRLCFDATDEKALRAALVGVDGVVNCVGGSPATIVSSARCLFRAAIPTGPVVVQLSSMAVYGAAQGEVDEQAPLRGDCGAYGVAKVEAERLASDYHRAVILRPGCVYGPRGAQWSERLARLLRTHRIGDLGAGGDGFANMVHVEDVAAAALAALRRPDGYGQAYNLALPNPPTWNDFFLQFARALGAVPIARLSERRLALETRLLAPPLKVAEILAGRLGLGGFPPPAIPPSLARLWRQEIRLLVGKAENHLDMRWTSLDRGLAETARSLQTHAG